MRSFAAALLLAAPVLIAAQDISSLPACVQTCLATALASSSCSPTDIACLCADSAFTNGATTCVVSSCDTAGQQAALQYSQSSCGAGAASSIVGGASSAASGASSAASGASSAASSAAAGASSAVSSASSRASSAAGSASSAASSAARPSASNSGAGQVAAGGLLGLAGVVVAML